MQPKSKPSDNDIVFGNSCLLFRKHYGWEKSRIEWLLQLEQEQKPTNQENKQHRH